MKLRLLALPAALSALALISHQAQAAPAAPKPQVVDPAGDARSQQSAHDIVSTTFEVTKTAVVTTKKVKGKTVKSTTYVPKDFVVTLKLAGAPSQEPGVDYWISAGSACGDLTLQSYYDASAQGMVQFTNFSDCGPDQSVAGLTVNTYDLSPDVVFGADFISYTMPFKSLPKQIKLGSTFTAPYVYTALADPLVGFDTVGFVDPATAVDDAKGADFKLG